MPTEGASVWRSRSAPARPLARPRTGALARPAGSLPVRAWRPTAAVEAGMHFRCKAGGSTKGAKTSQPGATPWEPRRKATQP